MSEHRKAGPPSFGQAAKQMMSPQAAAPRLTPEEEAQIEAEEDAEVLGDGPVDSPLREAADRPPEADHPVIAMVPVPPDLAFPPWKQIGYFLFKPGLTERPDLGNRTCVTWGLSVADERLSKQAARGDSSRTYEELAKRTIRVLDGVRADWTGKGGRGSVNRFWEEIGPKARSFIINAYMQTHTPTAEETADFFVNCTTYRTSVVVQQRTPGTSPTQTR